MSSRHFRQAKFDVRVCFSFFFFSFNSWKSLCMRAYVCTLYIAIDKFYSHNHRYQTNHLPKQCLHYKFKQTISKQTNNRRKQQQQQLQQSNKTKLIQRHHRHSSLQSDNKNINWKMREHWFNSHTHTHTKAVSEILFNTFDCVIFLLSLSRTQSAHILMKIELIGSYFPCAQLTRIALCFVQMKRAIRFV